MNQNSQKSKKLMVNHNKQNANFGSIAFSQWQFALNESDHFVTIPLILTGRLGLTILLDSSGISGISGIAILYMILVLSVNIFFKHYI